MARSLVDVLVAVLWKLFAFDWVASGGLPRSLAQHGELSMLDFNTIYKESDQCRESVLDGQHL